MSERFFCPTAITDEVIEVELSGAEAHHLLHVMRYGVGTQVTLFDGNGSEFEAEVIQCQRATVRLKILDRQHRDRELLMQLIVAVALPKGERQKWLVEKLTELGVAELIPLVTERGVAQPGGKALERLQRTVIEASKQSGRNQLMAISAPLTWGDFLKRSLNQADEKHDSVLKVVAHPQGASLGETQWSGNEVALLAIGPEGGLTTEEIRQAESAGWQVVSLGPTTLRVETAAVALAAILASKVSP